ncbi:MAG: LAGLIDADG family homing endonuclease [Nitrospirota bacterium]
MQNSKEQLRLMFDSKNKKIKPDKYGLITRTLTKEKLEDLYYVQNKSLQDIANEFNCTRPMVMLLMNKYGLQRRKRSEARVLAIKERKIEKFEYDNINENFFSEWTPGMAWVLGILFTDGNVQYTTKTGTGLRVSISSVDLELLEKVRTLLNSTKPIKKNVQSYDKSKYIYRFEFFREKMREDLHKLGLIQRKSLIMKFPDIPEKYMRHFIRGCWDGDGTVYISAGKLNASYVSSSRYFIERLVQEFYKIGIYRQRLHQLSFNKIKKTRSKFGFSNYPLAIHAEKRSKAYYIKLNSRENLEKLFHYLYDGVDESIYLARKYKKCVEGLGLEVKDSKEENRTYKRYKQVGMNSY